MLSKEKTREIKEQMLERYLSSVKNGWYAPDGYIFVTNAHIKSEYSKKWCKTENPNEYTWLTELLQEYREKYGDVRVVDICSDIDGKEWNGSEIGEVYHCYSWTNDVLAYKNVALYVPIKAWLELPFE